MAADDDAFYKYYEAESLEPATLDRFAETQASVLRVAQLCNIGPTPWNVADIGCGAGTQCMLWARAGHSVFGLDVNARLVALGRERAAAAGLKISLSVGSATGLPWPDSSMDICLCPELLEHVADWETVLREAIRVLKAGGVLYLSTTNKLCPRQAEFDLPAYSWYPGFLKRRYERLAVTSRPDLVNHAKYPAVNWFTYFGLRRYLQARGLACLDRFDVASLKTGGLTSTLVLAAIRSCAPLRWCAHALTPYTMIFARKTASKAGAAHVAVVS